MKITEQTLSAWIDDSLSRERMKEVSAAVESDPELQVRAAALRSVGELLRKDPVEVPVTAERMITDVRREIRRKEASVPQKVPVWTWAGATVCAGLLIAALLIPSIRESGDAAVAQTEIESVDSGLSGASTMVYTDHVAGWTVVWLDGVELEPGT